MREDLVKSVYNQGFVKAERTKFPARSRYSEVALLSLGDDIHFVRILQLNKTDKGDDVAPEFILETGLFGVHCLRVIADSYLDVIEFFRETNGILSAFQMQYLCEMVGEIGTPKMAENSAKLAKLLTNTNRAGRPAPVLDPTNTSASNPASALDPAFSKRVTDLIHEAKDLFPEFSALEILDKASKPDKPEEQGTM